MEASATASTGDKVPVQERSERTRQALLDALERLLGEKGFAELTVAEIAVEAGLSTGAIYGRFRDKRDLLRAAFDRFHERTAERNELREATLGELSDVEVIRRAVEGMLDYALAYLPLMRAAAALDDAPSFERMRQARSEVAAWLSDRLTSSPLEIDERSRRCRFALRTATAVIRDTFLSGPGAVAIADGDTVRREEIIDSLVADLTMLVAAYLEVDRPSDRRPSPPS